MKALALAFALLLPTANAADCVDYPAGNAISFLEELTGWVSKSALHLDPALLTDWQQGQRPPCAEPFLATFRKNGMELRYLAVSHVNPPLQIQGSDLEILERETKAFKPKRLVLEMASYPDAFIPPEDAAGMASGCFQGGDFHCGESQFLLDLAGKNGLGVIAAEPDSPRLFSGLAKVFSLEEIYAFESTRAMHTLRLDPSIRAEDRPEKFMALIRQSISDERGGWSYEKYQAWLKQNLGPDFTAEKAELRWLEPRNDSGASLLNRMSYAADKIRDANVLSSIEKSLNETGRTMVVYGSSHFIRERKALEQALGPAEIRCLR